MASELELRTTKSFVIPSKARDLLFRWQLNTPCCCWKPRSLVLTAPRNNCYFAELIKSFFNRFTSTRAMLLFFPILSPATGVLPIPTT